MKRRKENLREAKLCSIDPAQFSFGRNLQLQLYQLSRQRHRKLFMELVTNCSNRLLRNAWICLVLAVGKDAKNLLNHQPCGDKRIGGIVARTTSSLNRRTCVMIVASVWYLMWSNKFLLKLCVNLDTIQTLTDHPRIGDVARMVLRILDAQTYQVFVHDF